MHPFKSPQLLIHMLITLVKGYLNLYNLISSNLIHPILSYPILSHPMIHRSIYIPHISPHYPHIIPILLAGWWCQTWLDYCPFHFLGLSSFPLTNSYFSTWLKQLPYGKLLVYHRVKPPTSWSSPPHLSWDHKNESRPGPNSWPTPCAPWESQVGRSGFVSVLIGLLAPVNHRETMDVYSFY